MTRRGSISSRSTRGRRSGPPTRRAGGPRFTTLGFAFFRLVSIGSREPGESPYAVVRLPRARAAMAAFVAL